MLKLPLSSPRRPPVRLSDLRGAVRLAVEGVQEATRIAQGLHGTIVHVEPPIGRRRVRPVGGLPGFVYRTVRAAAGLVGEGLDAAITGVQALLPPAPEGADGAEAESPQRLAVVGVLNGIVGDHLARTKNPLAIPMELFVEGPRRPHLIVLVHGLCMDEQRWTRERHDHGRALARALQATPVYVRYNSDRHVSENGEELALLLDDLVAHWPVPIESIAIIGHSMGGLVARNAVHNAQEAGLAWPPRVRQMVFLGTPHHGAPLERGGNWLHQLLGASPYVAPFMRLARVRSDGITDLRYGNVLAADWHHGRFQHRDTRTPVPLPEGVACYAVAGSLGHGLAHEVLGDGLVPVASALGRDVRRTHHLRIPRSHTMVAPGVHHLELLSDEAVYRRLRQWLLAA